MNESDDATFMSSDRTGLGACDMQRLKACNVRRSNGAYEVRWYY